MGDIEVGNCYVCGALGVPVDRKYYHYNIKCECHSPEHFEIVYHCSCCIPKPPSATLISVKPYLAEEILTIEKECSSCDGEGGIGAGTCSYCNGYLG